MKPIIHPAWIYLTEVFGSLKSVTFGIGIILSSIAVIALICSPLIMEMTEDVEKSTTKKFIKNYFKVIIFVFCVHIFTPSETTMYTMMAVEQITPDNIKAVGNTGKNIVEYLTDKISEIVNDEKEEK